MLPEDELLQQLMPIFQTELAEHLQAMNHILLALEEGPSPEKWNSLLEEIFREAHSLKGAAKGVGLSHIAEIAHKLESVFSAAKRDKLKINPAIFDLLYNSLDTIDATMQRVLKGQEPASIESLLERLEAAAQGKAPRRAKKPQAATFTPDSAAKQQPAPVPELEPVVPLASSAKSPEELHPKSFKLEETVRVTTAKLDSLMARMGELLVAHLRSDQRLVEIKNIQQGVDRWHTEWGKLKDTYSQEVGRQAEREDLPLLKFIEKTSAQTKSLRQQMNSLIQNLSNDIRNMTLATDDLQEEIKKVRMLPATTIFDSCERMIRDLAREEHKQVKLHIQGAETELDKKVIEEIKDPVMHLLRNCVDHGIERPQERTRCGKSPQGMISLSVFQRGSNVVLEVTDDGVGIDVEKIKRVAVKKGFITPKEAEGLSDREAMNFIFKPGFSTSPILTDVSGRGVGLDVVREKVERLHGLINFESTPGEGSQFMLTLPLTLSTSHVCLVKCGGETFAIPLCSIDRILLVGYAAISSIESKMAIELDGYPISLVDLAQILQISPEQRKLTPDKKLPAVILGSAEKRVAFLVDALVGESKVVVKNLGSQLARVRNISGATILSTGKVIMMLNVGDLIKTVYNQAGTDSFSLKAVAPKEQRRNTILVVDDSITTRILEKNILETAGYEVVLASDGQEAWEMLGKNGCNLIVSDILMPRMNGFEFTAKVKRSEKYKDTPVILVTSLESREDKERGIEVGADAYIVKSSFDQANLLETIKRLI